LHVEREGGGEEREIEREREEKSRILGNSSRFF